MPTIVTPTQYPSFVPSLTSSNTPVAGNVYCLLSLHNNMLTISCDDPGHSSAPDPGPRRRTLRLSAAKPIDCRTPVAFLTARFSPGNTTGNHSGNKNGKSGKIGKIGNAKPTASNEPIPDVA